MKINLLNYTLWLSFLLAMGASISHLAWTFGTVERPGWEFLGWIPAIAVDAGLAALAYSIQQRKRAKRPVKILWAGVASFALISALANLYHALAVEGVTITTDLIVYAKAFVLSATLPAMYIFLGEIISGDDATLAEKAAKQSEREQRRQDLEAERQNAEAKRLLLAAENEQKRLEAERLQAIAEQSQEVAEQIESEPEPVKIAKPCDHCDYVAIGETERQAQNKLNAHLRQHSSNGVAKEAVKL